MQRLGGFQRHLAWKKYGRRWRLMPNKQPNRLGNVFKCTPSRPRMCPLAALRPCPLYMHNLYLGEGFFGGLRHHRSSGCTQEGLCSPICSSSLLQLLTMEVVGISFFQSANLFFSSAKAHLSLFVVYWLMKCTKMHMHAGAEIWPPARSKAICHAVLLCKAPMFTVCRHGNVLGEFGGQILPVNSVVIYFDCHPICQFSFGDPNAPEILKRKAIHEIPK